MRRGLRGRLGIETGWDGDGDGGREYDWEVFWLLRCGRLMVFLDYK